MTAGVPTPGWAASTVISAEKAAADGSDPRRADMKVMLATIGREAALRGIVLTMSDRYVTDLGGYPAPEGAELVAKIEAAWAATDGDKPRHAHVAQMAAAIAHNAVDRSGPVIVRRTAWMLIESYALTGAPPEREL